MFSIIGPSSTASVDIEAQILPVAPKPVPTLFVTRESLEHSNRTCEIPHGHSKMCSASVDNKDGDLPTDYCEPPPEYSEEGQEDQGTFAEYLFKYGFAFPLLWVMGAYILWDPLQAPPPPSSSSDCTPAWLPNKTDEEKEIILNRMRGAEEKWARRCLWACAVFIFISVAVVLVVLGALGVLKA